jgi:hypothetical protein
MKEKTANSVGYLVVFIVLTLTFIALGHAMMTVGLVDNKPIGLNMKAVYGGPANPSVSYHGDCLVVKLIEYKITDGALCPAGTNLYTIGKTSFVPNKNEFALPEPLGGVTNLFGYVPPTNVVIKTGE